MNKSRKYNVAVRGTKLEGTKSFSIEVTANNVAHATGLIHGYLWKGTHISKERHLELLKQHVTDISQIEDLYASYHSVRVKALPIK